MHKSLNSFLFTPIFVLLIVLASYTFSYVFFSDNLTNFTKVWGPLDYSTYVCYLSLLFCLTFYRKDFATKGEKKNYALFWFWSVIAFLREAGIQHWLASKDSTAFKIRFFTNPDNPLYEKIISAVLLIIVAFLFIYTMYLFLVPAFKGFFSKMSGSLSVITFLSVGALSKIVDRLPGNLNKYGIVLNKDERLFGSFQVLEETLEMCLPILAIVMLIQFHKNKKVFFPCI